MELRSILPTYNVSLTPSSSSDHLPSHDFTNNIHARHFPLDIGS